MTMKRIIFILVLLVSVVSGGYSERLVKTFEYHFKPEDFPIIDTEDGMVGISSNVKGFGFFRMAAYIPEKFMTIAIPGKLRLDTMYCEGERILLMENPQIKGVGIRVGNKCVEQKSPVSKKGLAETYGNVLRNIDIDDFGVMAYVYITFAPFQYDETDDKLYFYPDCKLVFEFEDNPDAPEPLPFYQAPLEFIENPEDAIEIMRSNGLM